MSLTIQQWKDSGLVPLSGLQAWHKYEAGVSANGLCNDYSGNGRHLSQGTTPPVLTPNVINGQPAWVYDGSKNPLNYASAVSFKHLFIVAAYLNPTFTEIYTGLLQDAAVWLILGNSTPSGVTKFDNINAWGADSFLYRKNDVAYALTNMQAPMSNIPALMEVQIPIFGVTLSNFQVGGNGPFTNKWKGFFVEALSYSRVLTDAERQRVMLYLNLKYALFKTAGSALPLYFPSDDFMNFRRRRFYAEPPMYSKITDSFEFEDGGRTFNESGDEAPRRWEYDYNLVNTSGATDPPEVRLFDEFYETVRLSQAFNFTDKYGTVWDNVRIESYDRDHDTYKPWRQTVRFKLVRYPS